MRKSFRQEAAPPGPARKPARETPTTGFVLVVDGQMKGEFKTAEAARARAEGLKRRFPALQVRIFDAQSKCVETVELAEA
jgi:hypothetical protein